MNHTPIQISKSQARKLVLLGQGLAGKIKGTKGKQSTLVAIGQLGYVQIDTISVVNRAHHHTCWVRNPGYDPSHLHSLLSEDKTIFEYWSHAAAYLPIQDFRFSYWRKEQVLTGQKRWFPEDKKTYDWVYDRVKAEGPLSSKDFKAPEHKSGAWWGWKPAKIALEQLFHEGRLMIKERRKFQKVYDLTERVLPSNISTQMPSGSEMARHLIDTTLRAQGIASVDEMCYLRRNIKTHVKEEIRNMIEEGTILPVKVREYDTYQGYVFKESLENEAKRFRHKAIHILSPFDNLVIQRKRMQRFFDFDYQIECYVPEPKRIYGYFSLPILWGDRFIGRMDTKADRKQKTFIIKNLVWERAFKDNREFLPAFGKKLRTFMEFNDCDHIDIQASLPEKLSEEIKKSIQ